MDGHDTMELLNYLERIAQALEKIANKDFYKKSDTL
jgi:hypothetical protein